MADLLQRDWCSALILSLAHFFWQGLLIAIVLAVILRSLRSVTARYNVSLAAFLLMAVCPVGTFGWLMLLSPHIAVPPSRSPQAVVPEQPRVPSVVSVKPIESQMPTDWPAASPPATVAPLPSPKVESVRQEPFSWTRFAPELTGLYLLGVSIMLLRLILGLWGGRGLRRRATPIQDPHLLSALERQASALGLRLLPILAYCDRITVPTLIGVLKPTILLPLSISTGLSPDQVESVLAHELAHLRRYDHLVNLLQRVVESFLFFHPAVWWVSRRIRDEREHCCDDLVISCGAQPLDYAQSLLRVAELSREAQQQRPHPGLRPIATVSLLATGDRPSTLRQRIARMLGLQPEQNVRAMRPMVLAGLTVGGLGIAWTLMFMTWAAVAEIQSRAQSTVVVEWSVLVDDTTADEIRRLAVGTSVLPKQDGTEAVRVTAEELRDIVKSHLQEPGRVALGSSVKLIPVTSGGFQQSGRAHGFAESRTMPPGRSAQWQAGGTVFLESRSNAANLTLKLKYNVGATATTRLTADVALTESLRDGDGLALLLTPQSDNEWKPCVVVVYQALQIPSEQVRSLQATLQTSDLVEHGPKALREHLAKVDQWQRQAKQSIYTQDPTWTRSLPGGAFVQLVGIGRPADSKLVWWTPDGQPLNQTPPDVTQAISQYGMAAIVRVWEQNTSRTGNRERAFRFQNGLFDIPDKSAAPGSQLVIVPVDFDRATGRANLNIGVGSGIWRSQVTMDSGASLANLDDIEITRDSAQEFPPGQTTTSFHWKPTPDIEVTALAVTSSGKAFEPASNPMVYANRRQDSNAGNSFTHAVKEGEIHYYLLKSRPIIWTEFTRFAIEPLAQLNPPGDFTQTDNERQAANFTASIDDTVKVELVGLAPMVEHPQQWWRPDGTPLTPAPDLDKSHGFTQIQGQEGRRVLLKVRGVNSYSDVTASISGTRLHHHLPNGEKLVTWVGALPRAAGTNDGTLTVGIATEPISPIRILEANGQRRSHTNGIIDPVLEDIFVAGVTGTERTELRLASAVPWDRADLQIVAIDKEGKRHERFTSGSSQPDLKQSLPYILTLTFPAPQSQIDRFEYRFRLFRQWVTFTKISLEPGHNTKVGVTVERNTAANSTKDDVAAVQAVELQLRRFIPSLWHSRVEQGHTIHIKPGSYLPPDDDPHVILAFTTSKDRPKVQGERPDETYEYLDQTPNGHAHLFISMRLDGDSARHTKIMEMFDWPQAQELCRAFIKGDTKKLTDLKNQSDDGYWARDGWGPVQNGLRSRWVRHSQNYLAGNPVSVEVEIKNFGTQTITYDRRQGHPWVSWQVLDANGKPVPFRRGAEITSDVHYTLKPNNSDRLFAGADLAKLFELPGPGKYTLRFTGKSVRDTSDVGALSNISIDPPLPPAIDMVIALGPDPADESKTEAAQSPKPAPLEFRFVAIANESTGEPRVPADFTQRHYPDHTLEGRKAAKDKGFVWLPITDKISIPIESVTNSKVRLGLVADTPEHALMWDGKWSIDDAKVQEDPNQRGQFMVSVKLNEAGGKALGVLTMAHLHNQLAIVIDNKIVMAPRVRSVLGRDFVIAGNMTRDEAEYLVKDIARGKPANPPAPAAKDNNGTAASNQEKR